MNVLVIDDERAFAEVLSELFTGEGNMVLTAFDSQQALRALEDNGEVPDLVVCDVMLPSLNGDQFIAKLRSRYPERHIPAVLLSAGAGPQALPPDVIFLQKPVDFDELLSGVQRLQQRTVGPTTN